MNDMTPSDTPLNLRSFLTFRLARLQAQINAQAQHVLRSHSDVGHTEWRVLILVKDCGDSTMAQIVRDVQIDKTQISRAVKALIEKGYLSARDDPNDHRQSFLSLTPEGRAVHAHLLPHMQDRQHALMADISEKEIAVTYSVIDRLEQAALRRDF